MKGLFWTVIFVLLSLLHSRGQATYSNDLIVTLAQASIDSLLCSTLCTDEVNKSAYVSNMVTKSSSLPFLTVSFLDADLKILSQTRINPPAFIARGKRFFINEISRIYPSSDCASGYILAGYVDVDSKTYGLLINLDDKGKVLLARYYTNVTELMSVVVGKGGYISTGKGLDGSLVTGQVMKVDCKLLPQWSRQILNYQGDLTCYMPYDSGSTLLKKIRGMGKGLYAIGGTASYMSPTTAIGDENLVLAVISEDGSVQWAGSYGDPGSFERFQESFVSLAIDTFDKVKPRIIVLGKCLYANVAPCNPNPTVSVYSNFLCSLTFDGMVAWTKSFARTDSLDSLRTVSDISVTKNIIAVTGAIQISGNNEKDAAIHRFDKSGALLELRYYKYSGNDLSLWGDDVKMVADSYGNIDAVGKLANGGSLLIQSYESISDTCNMFRESFFLSPMAMPYIALKDRSLTPASLALSLATDKYSSVQKIYCPKK